MCYTVRIKDSAESFLFFTSETFCAGYFYNLFAQIVIIVMIGSKLNILPREPVAGVNRCSGLSNTRPGTLLLTCVCMQYALDSGGTGRYPVAMNNVMAK